LFNTQDRKLFLEALKPPAGYRIDSVIGTTYSLDLVSLLMVPLTFTMLDTHDSEGNLVMDPLKLLEAVRRHAGNMVVFCQAGSIHLPRPHRSLYSYLESRVVEVQAPNPDGVFHPKVWVCRYIAEDKPVKYRALVQSRNLTFDRSWDVMLMLEGELQNRQNAFARNHPLGDFISALPGMAIHSIDPTVNDLVKRTEQEIRRVAFETPEPFREMKFWPLGIPNHQKWPFPDRMDRSLVISPFLSGPMLERLGKKGKDHVLVTRSECLDQLAATSLEAYETLYVLQDGGVPEPIDSYEEGAGTEEEKDELITSNQDGLHAKVYVTDVGWDSHVWVGSANATVHGFHKNVEFLVELEGKRSECGVEVMLGKAEQRNSLRRLLQEYPRPEPNKEAAESEHRKLEKVVDSIRRYISAANFEMLVSAGSESDRYRLTLRLPTEAIVLPEDAEVSLWPLSLKETMGVRLDSKPARAQILFGEVDVQGITSFVAFEIKIKGASLTEKARFICNFPLSGAPEDREERILRAMLSNRDDFLRYLFLLLSGEGEIGPGSLPFAKEQSKIGNQSKNSDWLSAPLFEVLLRALYRNPQQLDSVASLLESLRKTEDGLSVLPEGFLELWEPIWAVRKGASA
jgi:hypothetical protein